MCIPQSWGNWPAGTSGREAGFWRRSGDNNVFQKPALIRSWTLWRLLGAQDRLDAGNIAGDIDADAFMIDAGDGDADAVFESPELLEFLGEFEG